ncbi:MAG: CRISPR-associated protein Cas5 [bacterium]
MYRIVIKSKTAYFRNDVTCTSYQESFNCPPLSTIYGLIAASYGEYRYDINIGYLFNYEIKDRDFELVLRKEDKYKKLYYQMKIDNRFSRNDILRGCFGTIPVIREVLYNCKLILYIDNLKVAKSFNQPQYPLLLGRSEDLASVDEKPQLIHLQNINKPVNFGNTIIPFKIGKIIPGRISKMNIQISQDIPRKIERLGIFKIVDRIWDNIDISQFGKYDPVHDVGIYIHKGLKSV